MINNTNHIYVCLPCSSPFDYYIKRKIVHFLFPDFPQRHTVWFFLVTVSTHETFVKLLTDPVSRQDPDRDFVVSTVEVIEKNLTESVTVSDRQKQNRSGVH